MSFINNCVDVVKDYGRQLCIAVDPNRSKPEAEFTRFSDGSLDHNVDLSDFPPEKRQVAEQLIRDSVENIEEIEQQLADAREAGDLELESSLERKLDAAEDTFTQVKWQLETRDIDQQTISSLVQFGPVGVVATEALRTGKLDQRLKHASKQLDKANGANPAASSNAGVTGDGETGKASDAFERVMQDVSGAAARFEEDPQAFFAELKELSSDERAQVMTAIQTEIQSNNQLMSMLTNFQQAMHDTNKAVIANLRV